MRNKTFAVLAFSFLAGVLWAGNLDVGSSWLKVPGSAEAAGMGGAFGALGQDVNALSSNPAGLALLDGPQLSLMHDLWVQDLTTEHLAYGQSFRDGSGGALGLDYIDFGSVERYNVVSGAPVAAGTYSPMAANVAAGYALEAFQNLYAGLSVKLLAQDLGTQTNFSAAEDLGFLYKLPQQDLRFSLVLANLGWDLDQASLPTQLRLGAAYRLPLGAAHPASPSDSQTLAFGLEGDLALSDLNASNFSLGGEYWYQELLAVRAGYHFAPYGDLSGLAGLTLGAGVRYKNFELDYALTTLGDLGTSHQISLLSRL